MLTKDHAEKIAKKLKATIRPAKVHDIAVIEYDGNRITQFGIRRGFAPKSGSRSHSGKLASKIP